MDKYENESDTLVGGLCREIIYINSRSLSIRNSLVNCQSKLLSNRLKKELSELHGRRNVINNVSQKINLTYGKDNLSVEFLKEIIGRNLAII